MPDDSFAIGLTRVSDIAAWPPCSREIRRHALLFFDYFTQYAKVRIGYRGDFFISLSRVLPPPFLDCSS